MLLKNLEKALCDWDRFFDFNSQILIRSKFALFLLGNPYSYLILLGISSSAANLHPLVPFLAYIEPPLELTLCATRQLLQSRSLVHWYPKVSYMLLQHDLNHAIPNFLPPSTLAISRYINWNIKTSFDFQQ